MHHFQRGAVLYQQGRHADAIAEFQRHLLESPDDAITHALISFCLCDLEKYQAATEHAQQAIALAPESAIGFRALARCYVERNHTKEAKTAIEEALRLEPDSADCWATLAHVHLLERRWRDALDAANRGLTMEPDHPACTNLRAQALVNLGDRTAAAATMDVALALNPDDAWTHANQGWTLLHANDPKKAMEHFREALRLDPSMEWAKAGIVESMQARNFIYRYLLQYFLWAGRLPASWQWGLMIGGILGNRFLNQLAGNVPSLKPFIYPIIGVYVCFAMLTWLGPSFFNLLLRFDRFGRHALSDDQRYGANLLAVGLLPPIAFCTLGAITWTLEPFLAALLWFLTLMPASVIFRCDKGWPRDVMAAATGLLILVNLIASMPVLVSLGIKLTPAVDRLLEAMAILAITAFFVLFLGLQFLAQYLVQQRVRT